MRIPCFERRHNSTGTVSSEDSPKGSRPQRSAMRRASIIPYLVKLSPRTSKDARTKHENANDLPDLGAEGDGAMMADCGAKNSHESRQILDVFMLE